MSARPPTTPSPAAAVSWSDVLDGMEAAVRAIDPRRPPAAPGAPPVFEPPSSIGAVPEELAARATEVLRAIDDLVAHLVEEQRTVGVELASLVTRARTPAALPSVPAARMVDCDA